MKRKRLALIVLAVILLSGLTLTFVSAEIVIDGNTPGSAADDNKITSVFTWTGNGKVNVVGSTEGRSYLSSSVSSWTFSLSGVAATIEQAYLYIGTFQYSAASASWTVDLVDPLSGTTNIATGASTPYDGDEVYEVFRFDVSSLLSSLLLNVNGPYTVQITQTDGPPHAAVYGVGLVAVSSHPALPPAHVWINDGCEWIYTANTSTTFPDQGQWPTGTGANLYTIVAAGEDGSFKDDDQAYFDDNLLATNPFDSSNGILFDVDTFNVQPYMGAGAHTANFTSGTEDGYIVYSTVLSYRPSGMNVIPEVPYGTILSMTLLMLGFVVYTKRPF